MPSVATLPSTRTLPSLDQLLGGPARGDSGAGQRPLEPHLASRFRLHVGGGIVVAPSRLGAVRLQRDGELFGARQVGQVAAGRAARGTCGVVP